MMMKSGDFTDVRYVRDLLKPKGRPPRTPNGSVTSFLEVDRPAPCDRSYLPMKRSSGL